MRKIKVSVGKLIRYCSGVRHHAWYESNVGVIRKPIQESIYPGKVGEMVGFNLMGDDKLQLSWWKRLVLFIKRVLNYGKKT